MVEVKYDVVEALKRIPIENTRKAIYSLFWSAHGFLYGDEKLVLVPSYDYYYKFLDSIYCSPALRCVKTAAIVANSAKASCKLNIEAGLFENNNLYPHLHPKWVSRNEFLNAGFNVDMEYKSFYTQEQVRVNFVVFVICF